jgi:transposase
VDKENRSRMANIVRRTKRYLIDLTYEESARIEPMLPQPPKRGRKVSVDLREVRNAIRYMARSGGGWRMLPTNLAPWQTSKPSIGGSGGSYAPCCFRPFMMCR